MAVHPIRLVRIDTSKPMTRVTELDLVFCTDRDHRASKIRRRSVGTPERDRVRNVYRQQHAMSKVLRAITVRNGRTTVE
jgi:hypothetical protein